MIRAWLINAALILCLGAAAPARAETLTVFAASSLTDVSVDLGAEFTRRTGIPVRTAHGSSSQLARKIEFGAPADIFLSADRQWTDYLATRGFIRDGQVRPFAGNRLVMVRPKPGYPDSMDSLDALAGLRNGQRVAIGNPDHVPVGRYAKEALENMSLWQGVASRLAAMPNARAVLALVERGEVVAGFVYRTDSLISRSVQVVAEIPEERHRPIRYMAAITGSGTPAGRAFMAFLLSSEARTIIEKHGFTGIGSGD